MMHFGLQPLLRTLQKSEYWQSLKVDLHEEDCYKRLPIEWAIREKHLETVRFGLEHMKGTPGLSEIAVPLACTSSHEILKEVIQTYPDLPKLSPPDW